jgi:hypothetical protein
VHNSGKDRRRGEGERGGGKQWEVVLCKKMKVRRFLSVLSMSLLKYFIFPLHSFIRCFIQVGLLCVFDRGLI